MTTNDLKQISSLMDQKFRVFGDSLEERLNKRITAVEISLREEIATSGKKVEDNAGDFIEHTLMPLINQRFDTIGEELEEKADKADIDRIERKLDRLTSTDLDHEKRIRDIELVPVIAHELKHRKSK